MNEPVPAAHSPLRSTGEFGLRVVAQVVRAQLARYRWGDLPQIEARVATEIAVRRPVCVMVADASLQVVDDGVE